LTATAAPIDASSRATARPMPRLAPVTSATFVSAIAASWDSHGLCVYTRAQHRAGQLARHPNEKISSDDRNLSEQERALRDFERRKRALVEADMLIVANDHWNFDVRGFNPGGNHGSFFRISTHSIFMLAGGQKTNIPRAFEITKPYDSLSFVPTLLALTGNLRDDNNPVPKLQERGFTRFPGRLVTELLSQQGVNASP